MIGALFRQLSVRERAVLLVSAIALVVAVICLGLFTSTGLFEYGGYTIGGTFVGFLGTVTVLTRLYLQAGGTLIDPKERADANFSVENITESSTSVRMPTRRRPPGTLSGWQPMTGTRGSPRRRTRSPS
jgi:hypothetical protein